MRLATKLTIGFLIVVLLVTTGYEYSRLRQEISDFEEDMDRSHLLVAIALSDTLKGVAAQNGVEAARALLRQVHIRVPDDVRVRWVCSTSVDSPPPPVRCEDLRGAALRHEPLRAVSERRRFTLKPVMLNEDLLGAIEVSETSEREGKWVNARFREALLLALLVVAACTLSAFFLGLWLVGRPTRQLFNKARAVGRGELDPPLQLKSNDELGVLATEMNAMCEHLREARNAAARELAERLKVLEQLRHADRLVTVGRLASGLAHELGTPLNVVETRAELISNDDGQDEATRSSAQVIVTCAERMAHLVRQLLMFARQRGLQRGPVTLASLAETVANVLGPLASRSGVRLRVERSSSPGPVRADEILLQQAVTNVVVNAVQASRSGDEVALRISERDATRPGTQETRRYSCITVQDRGTGIPPEHHPQLFEPFFTTKRPGEGTGLGLAVAWGIVEEHEGWIDLKSEVGRGTEFTLMLPREES